MSAMYPLPKLFLEEYKDESGKSVIKATFVTPLDGKLVMNVENEKQAFEINTFLTLVYNEGVRLGKNEVINAISHSLRYFIKG